MIEGVKNQQKKKESGDAGKVCSLTSGVFVVSHMFTSISLVLAVVESVPPADDEQVARVPQTGEQEKRRAQAG